jgi:hypothetical protein
MPSFPILRLFLSACILALSSVTLFNMWKANALNIGHALFLVLPSIRNAEAVCNAESRPVSLDWHRPNATSINNLTAVINGTGVFGFQFDAVSSSDVPYRTYNWCNMPHVRQQEYVVAPSDYQLEYVEVVSWRTLGVLQPLMTNPDPTTSQADSIRR